MAKSDLDPASVSIIVDSREKTPFDLSPFKVVPGKLETGDYSVVGLTHCIAVERKSLQDLINCVGPDRERFEKEVQRLLAYETRAIVVEGSWRQLEGGNWHGRTTAESAVGSVIGWIARGIPVVMAGDRERAQKIAGRIMFLAARRRWRELMQFKASVVEVEPVV